MNHERKEVFSHPCLALITDRRRAPQGLVEAAAQAVAAGVDLVQLRERDLPPEALLGLARALRALTRGRALLIINSAVEVALAVDADGVHLPENGPPIDEVRARIGSRLLGCSAHSAAAASRAAAAGADYLQVGPIYPTATHPERPPAGLELLRAVRQAVDVPVLAVGGITPGNAAATLEAGADGLAVIGAVLGSADPASAVEQFRAALQSHRPGRKGKP